MRARYVYVGDSANDASCFCAFPYSVGVKNLSGELTLRPRFMTRFERSRGFLELSQHLLSLVASQGREADLRLEHDSHRGIDPKGSDISLP